MIYQPSVSNRNPLAEIVEGVPSRGIFTDFDMAFELGADSKAQLEVRHRRIITGTLPFMGRDLVLRLKRTQNTLASPAEEKPEDRFRLQPKARDPKYDLYRYDLESFFYILIWAATITTSRKENGSSRSQFPGFNTGAIPM